MKHTCLSFFILALLLVMACTKQSATVPIDTPSQGINSPQPLGYATARLAGPDYSQSIPVDTANRMLQSYLNSVGYPALDTALRSLSFDADTLRAYLQNPDIVTMKFMFAHKQTYINAGNYSKASGMNPAAITMIIVGLNQNDQYVRNNKAGVYDHLYPCPSECSGNSSAAIY